ncbi:hypothetical protein HMPREF9075_02689 [Capnocytophaga sp. oral taxon 332 str. F0381]|nr:hypothetical protein HMPREF9075_02689 [Capnocytophaga sp. oral taxon 332 str. F0381]
MWDGDGNKVTFPPTPLSKGGKMLQLCCLWGAIVGAMGIMGCEPHGQLWEQWE